MKVHINHMKCVKEPMLGGILHVRYSRYLINNILTQSYFMNMHLAFMLQAYISAFKLSELINQPADLLLCEEN